jgi:carbonic anhydrase
MTLARLALLAAVVLGFIFWRPVLFFAGGGLLTAGHLVQGFVSGFSHSGEIGTPEQLLDTILIDNQSAARAEHLLPTPRRKPEVMAVMCMDPRLNSESVLGDSRSYYDVVRLPGSVLSDEMIEAIELAVEEHHVRLVLFTTHTDCAMEKVAASPSAEHFPALSDAVRKREQKFQELLRRPAIARHLQAGDLLIKRFVIETHSGKLTPYREN